MKKLFQNVINIHTHMKGIVLIFFFLCINSLSAQISVFPTDATGCNKNDGKAVVNITTAATGFVFEYSKDGTTFQPGNTFENLSAGSYTATVRDQNTKRSFSKNFEIKSTKNSLKVTISGNDGPVPLLICESAPTLTLTTRASGGSGNYDYTWAGATKAVSSSGWYPVTATDKKTGCTADASVFVLFVPLNGFYTIATDNIGNREAIKIVADQVIGEIDGGIVPTGEPVVTTSLGNTLFIKINNLPSSPVVIDSTITVVDEDNTLLASATVTITTNFISAQDSLIFTNQNGISGFYNNGVLMLSGSASVANYATALRSIRYTNKSNTPDTTIRTIRFIVNDGLFNSVPAFKKVNIVLLPCQLPDNTPPVIVSKNITINLDATGHATIQPSDVIQSITDNCTVDYTSLTVSPNNFSCSAGSAAPHQAYVSNTSTGNQAYLGEMGMDFTVNTADGIQVNQLGAFDHQSNGITGTQSGGVRVAIFNKATQTIVPGLNVIISGSTDPLVANHRMKSIPTVTLMPGNYVIVAKGYNAAELNGNAGVSGSPFAAGDNGGGAITYTNRISWGDNNSSASFGYPPSSITASTNEYHAGTFNYASGSAAPHQAYVSNTSTGNQAYLGEMGMDFTVNTADGIQVNQLGAFDHQSNGITGTQSGGVRVAIFNKTTQTIVPGLNVIISGSTDPLVANHRMKSITPVTLMPGNYVIVAKGYNAAELNGNAGVSGGPFAAGDNGSSAITYTNRISWGDNNSSTSFGYPPSSITASTNEYHAGTFNYASGTTSTVTSHQAYVSNTSTGNQAYLGEGGMDFTVNTAGGIQVNQLGAFDHQSNGITGTQSGGVRVAIFNKTTQTIVPGLNVIISGSTDPLVANHRMKSITPVTLTPGNYVIVAKGYNAAELNGNAGVSGGPFAAGDNGGGAITYTNRISWGDNNSSASFAYPPNAQAGSTNEFHGGTFNYLLSTTNTNTVTISARDMSGNVSQVTAKVTVMDPMGSCSATPIAAGSIAPAEQPKALMEVSKISIYPNPTSGTFNVLILSLAGPKVSIEITDGNGKVLAVKVLALSSKTPVLTVPFELGSKAVGMYWVKVVSASGVQTAKVLIQR